MYICLISKYPITIQTSAILKIDFIINIIWVFIYQTPYTVLDYLAICKFKLFNIVIVFTFMTAFAFYILRYTKANTYQ